MHGLKQAPNHIDLAIYSLLLMTLQFSPFARIQTEAAIGSYLYVEETCQTPADSVKLNLCSRINARCSDVGVLLR